MDDENYPTTDGVDETTASKDTPDNSGSDSQDSMEGETSLLPKSFFQGKDLTVGNECKVKIEHVYDDEVEVSYVPHSTDEESGETSPDDETMEAAQSKLDGMATPAM